MIIVPRRTSHGPGPCCTNTELKDGPWVPLSRNPLIIMCLLTTSSFSITYIKRSRTVIFFHMATVEQWKQWCDYRWILRSLIQSGADRVAMWMAETPPGQAWIGQLSMTWPMICTIPQSHSNNSLTFHLWRKYVHLPCRVWVLFRAVHIRREEKKPGTFTVGSSIRLLFGMLEAAQTSDHLLWTSLSSTKRTVAGDQKCFLDFSRWRGCCSRSGWSCSVVFVMVFTHSLTAAASCRIFVGSMLASTDSQGSGLDVRVPLIMRRAALILVSIKMRVAFHSKLWPSIPLWNGPGLLLLPSTGSCKLLYDVDPGLRFPVSLFQGVMEAERAVQGWPQVPWIMIVHQWWPTEIDV